MPAVDDALKAYFTDDEFRKVVARLQPDTPSAFVQRARTRSAAKPMHGAVLAWTFGHTGDEHGEPAPDVSCVAPGTAALAVYPGIWRPCRRPSTGPPDWEGSLFECELEGAKLPPEARHLIEVGCWQIKSGQPPNWIRAGRVEAWVAAFWNVEWFYPLRWWEKVYLGRRVAIRGNVLLVAKDWAAARDRDFDQLIWLSPPLRAKRLGPLLESIEFAE